MSLFAFPMPSIKSPRCGIALLICGLIATPALASDAGITVQAVLTYGLGGPERRAQAISGDLLCISVEVDGLTADERGGVKLHTEVSFLTNEGQVLAVAPSTDLDTPLPLGGNKLKCFSLVRVPRDATPGKYSVRVNAHDELSDAKAVALIPIDVLDRKTFGAVGLRLSGDAAGKQPTGGVFFTGQTAYVNFFVVGYEVLEGSVRLKATIETLDEDRRPLSPIKAKLEPHAEGLSAVTDEPKPLYFNLTLNRPGRFVLHLELEDLLGKKQAEYDLPIVVSEPFKVNTPRTAGTSENQKH